MPPRPALRPIELPGDSSGMAFWLLALRRCANEIVTSNNYVERPQVVRLNFSPQTADIRNMCCPKCRSNCLMIKQRKGLERLRIFLTGLREYRCRDCDTRFRGPDRRSIPRDQELGRDAAPKQI